MKIIPVIDLKSGCVVHAQRGDRDAYRPIRSPLAQGSDPVDVARGLMRLFPFDTVYLADIDSIQRTGDNRDAIAAVGRALPGVALWVDCGLADIESFAKWQEQRFGRAVIGTEANPGAELILALRETTVAPPVLSLDFGPEGYRGPQSLLEDPALWPRDVIVMTLAHVGSDRGPALPELAAVIARAPTHRVFAAGGVRGAEDLAALATTGAAGVLVASSLHDGRLGCDALRADH